MSSQTDKLMAGTKFSDYFGLKHYKNATKLKHFNNFKRENIEKKVLAELGFEPGTLAFEFWERFLSKISQNYPGKGKGKESFQSFRR